MQLWHFDNFDNQLGVIQGLTSCIYEFKVAQSHALKFTCETPVEKEDRILFQDRTGVWREFIVEDAEDNESGLYEVACVDSIDELGGDYHVEREPSGTMTVILTALLENSRWQVGTVNVTGTTKVYWYHQSALEALEDLCEELGCEWSTTIEVSGDYVITRKLNLLTRVGKDTGNRFVYGHNLEGVTRERGQNKIYTRVYGYGKGEAVSEREDGRKNYGRKITFGSVNGGKDYVESNEARDRWGRPDGKGGKAHVVGKVEFSECEDPRELLRLTTEWAEQQYQPQISYTAKVIDLSRGALDVSAIDEGDDVAIIDNKFDPPLRLKGRVMAGKIDLLAPENTTYTIGNVRDSLAKAAVEQQRQTSLLRDRAGEWDAAVYQPTAWLSDLMDHLNEEFNAGGSYKYESFENGTIYSSVPLDENGKPTRTPASAFQLTGEGFRIASEVNEQGEFVWRTFGTGNGFTASEIVAGILYCGQSFFNVQTGEIYLEDGSIVINGKNGTKIIINPQDGFRIIDSAGEIIAGTEYEGDTAFFYSDRLGRKDGYCYVGDDPNSPYGAFGYVQNGVDAFKVMPWAADGARAGIYMYFNGKRLISVDTRDGDVVVETPSISFGSFARLSSKARISIDRDHFNWNAVINNQSSSCGISLSPNYGTIGINGYNRITFDSTFVRIGFSSTCYIHMDSTGITCRCGSHGFGWHNGKFESDLIWS